MGNRVNLSFGLLVILVLNSCEEADITGMFVSGESVNQRFEQSIEWNTIHPFRQIRTSTDDYTILSNGDSHVGGTRNLDSLFACALHKGAEAVVLVGDITTGHQEDFSILEQHLPSTDTLPTFLLPGNHDLYFDGWPEFFSRFGSSTYLFTIQTPDATDLYICLDTGGGTLGNRQLDWLKETLRNLRPDHRRCVIFTHNNLFRFRRTTSTNPNVEEVVKLLEIFAAYEVDMVITAHDHERYTEEFGNTRHIVMDASRDGLENAGYLRLDVASGELGYRFRSF